MQEAAAGTPRPPHSLVPPGCCRAVLGRAAALNPPEPQVYTYAVQYITVRSWGILAAMLGFVASGTYRQVQDPKGASAEQQRSSQADGP